MADSTIVLVTGANSGIGYEAIKILLQSERKYTILLGGRDEGKINSAVETLKKEYSSSHSTLEALHIDLASDESITKAKDTVEDKYGRLDSLVNNAGVSMDATVLAGKLTLREAWAMNWDINVTGTHIATQTFLPLLLKSKDPRIVFNTSGMSSLARCSDPNSPWVKYPEAGLPKPFSTMGYMSSKTGLNMVMVQWARVLKNDGVKVWAVSPGFLATNLGGRPELLKQMGAGDPSQGGRALVGCVEGERDGEVGRVVNGFEEGVQDW
ncbi:hypothetical protein PRZ48_008337 [Zasmidium cellare]|uniref:Uncharacterized protein n=1 Tax=Zasmidium cellare TaxID=395010 RepID=A0ABR0EFY4_ZASCE|nr:hypothetical protein PRZ48_008337 [Zasmidium cellare]